MTGYVYVLKCCDDTFYTGSTVNLDRRITEHMSGNGANYTKTRLPVQLVYHQYFMNISDAFYYEQKIKKWSQAKKLAIINNNWELLPELSNCKNDSNYKNNKKED